jgi:hypothetical protein
VDDRRFDGCHLDDRFLGGCDVGLGHLDDRHLDDCYVDERHVDDAERRHLDDECGVRGEFLARRVLGSA